ncbi:relaxase/mobilization nuclease-like protein [Chitinophaga niastensis]|uniref:Relaxase/mobilization nuclease-like protein n=1 Tax=Chitinophaga niastensis TaxID=536980 RepID=A0A2P8H9F0_CHINA|nr:relaxase/mobilization nuclease domain-containing protein [Chitinophaga niastensis]PSL42834.1 relaxase/mobilization nuclease-like protein [Chitinophaga niastensis]
MSTGKSIRGALHYNERKVELGNADLIFASKFACDTDDLTFHQKLKRFKALTNKNRKIKTNTLHISLNFSNKEELSIETLQELSLDYMNRIGFGGQPFLVYQHRDAAHPHVHIVTTNVQANGKPINLHNIAKIKSEPARKAIEKEYNLIVAEGSKESIGIHATIDDIVSRVTSTHLYTTLDELNAILRLHNVIADRGEPGTLLYERRGLTYSQLDRFGGKTGIPIPASSISSFPGLDYIEKRMAINGLKILPMRQRMDKILQQGLLNSNTAQLLQKQNIFCHLAYNPAGQLTDVILVDSRTRAAVSVADLNYHPSEFYDRLRFDSSLSNKDASTDTAQTIHNNHHTNLNTTIAIYQHLFSHENTGNDLLPEFLKKRKKKRRKF